MANQALADELMRISNEYRLAEDFFRSKAYEKASVSISKFPVTITSGKQAKLHIAGIGPSIMNSIDAYLSTGHSDRFINQSAPYAHFERIHGIGAVKAKKLYEEGYRTLEDLKHANLTKAQRIGLRYYHDFDRKIPRDEMDRINQLFHRLFDPFGLTWEIAGSYRRGAAESGDIDVIFKQDLLEDGDMLYLSDITNTLGDYLIDDLTDPEKSKTKYMGVIKVGEYARRIDIRLIRPESYYFALLYFTGSKELNIEMRNRAIELGMTLNEYSLDDVVANSERDIFRALKIKYIPPHDR